MKIPNRIKVKHTHYSIVSPERKWREYIRCMNDNYGLQFTSYRVGRLYFKPTDKHRLSLFIMSNGEYIIK